MPLLYLAKINLNSNIFDVYDKTLDLKKILDSIINNLSTNESYDLETKEKFNDSLGNSVGYIRKSKYSFQELSKDETGVITGKLVREYDKPSEKLDEETKKMITVYNKEAVSIYFYYDVYNEMVTFCERQSFGYNQFMNAFAFLLNSCVRPYEFEIFLQKDRDVLEDKLKLLISIQMVKATLIPPNSNDDDLQDLRKELLYMQQCEEANALKVDLVYTSNNMNMESKVMSDIKTAVSRGYGDLNATGINVSGRKQTIRSSQDAAYTVNIQENINKHDFIEESKGLIIGFLAKLTRKF